MNPLLVVILAAPLVFAAPSIREIYPHGAQRGKSLTVTLRGDELPLGAKIQTTLRASFSPLVPSKETMRPNSELPFLVELKPDTPVGLYPIRLITSDGISNLVLFSVGDLPEVEENEAKNPKQLNDEFEKAQKVPAPAVINGTLTAADIDLYSFMVKAGQKLVFEVEARRAGSAIDPAIEVFDSSRRQIAKNDDAPSLGVDSRLEVTFPKAGTYFVRVHDSRYSDQTQNFYRLKIGSYAYAEALFPLGWRRGEPVEVALVGGNLGEPVKVKPDLNVKAGLAPVRLPGSPSLPLFFAVSDQKELLEPESGDRPYLEDRTIMNGRISRAGEVDSYRLRVAPGEKWVFELTASSLGTSKLDGIITLLDEKGKKLASRDDTNGADPVLPFTIPAGVREIQVAVEDVLHRGGLAFGYRLEAKHQPPDFTAELLTPFVNVPQGGTAQVAVLIRRRGHEGPIRLTIPNLPPGFKAAGGHIPQEAADQSFNNDNMGFRSARSVLTITADPDAKQQFLELSLVAEADTPEGKIQRVAKGPGLIARVRGDRQRAFTAPWLEIELPLAVSKPLPIALDTPVPLARFAQGFEWPLAYKVRRASTAKFPVKVNNEVAGNVGNLRILKPENKNPDEASYLVTTNFATPLTTFDMILEAQTEIDGKPVTISSPAVSIQVVAGYEISVDAPARPLTVSGTVRREPTFEGSMIRLAVEDAPENVKCATLEVAEDQNTFTMSCEADGAVKPGTYPIRIVSAAPNTGRKTKGEYKIGDVETKLIVGGNVNAKK